MHYTDDFVATLTQGTPTSGGHPVTRSLDEIRCELVCPDPLATLGDDRGERDLARVHTLERRMPTRNLLLAQARPCQLAAQAVPSLLRTDLITTLQEDFILMARAKGVSKWKVLLRHALRPSFFSLITYCH